MTILYTLGSILCVIGFFLLGAVAIASLLIAANHHTLDEDDSHDWYRIDNHKKS
jgi:hypothetical protein